MTTTQAWIHALRLRTLPLSIAGILTGSACALHRGAWNWGIFGLALLTTVLFQIISNLANDLGDTLKGADNANRVGPERAVQSGVISVAQMKFAVAFTSVLSFLSAGTLIWLAAKQLTQEVIIGYLILAVACILAAIGYTLGKKAYGYLGLGDIFVFIFFGLVGVVGVIPLYADSFQWIEILPAIAIGLLSSAVLNLNNMRDQENDAAVGKRTLVVKIGAKAAVHYHRFLIIGAFISLITYFGITQQWFAFIACLPFVLLFKHLRFVGKNKEFKQFDTQLKPVAMSTFFISVLYWITTFIVHVSL